MPFRNPLTCNSNSSRGLLTKTFEDTIKPFYNPSETLRDTVNTVVNEALVSTLQDVTKTLLQTLQKSH